MKFTSGSSGSSQQFSTSGAFKVSTSYGASFVRPARNAATDDRTLQAVLQTVQGGDLPRAIVMAEAALGDGFEHAVLLNLSALRLENEGRLPEADRKSVV